MIVYSAIDFVSVKNNMLLAPVFIWICEGLDVHWVRALKYPRGRLGNQA